MVYIGGDSRARAKIINFSILPLILVEMFAFKQIFPEETNELVYAILFMGSMLLTSIIFLRHILKEHNTKTSEPITIGNFMSDPSVLKKTNGQVNISSEEIANLNEVKQEIEKLLSSGQEKISAFEIPQSYKVLLDQRTVKLFRQNIISVSDFLCNLNTQTDEFIKAKGTDLSTLDNDETFKAYLYGVSRSIESILFSANTCRTRVHFRLLNIKENIYDKYFICEDGKNKDDYLTPMKANAGIIKAAIDNRVSYVKSANLSLHQKSQNDSIWKDYITMVFFGKMIQKENREPFLSMTISISSPEEYGQLLYFLSFINIEWYIQQNIERVYEYCPIKPR